MGTLHFRLWLPASKKHQSKKGQDIFIGKFSEKSLNFSGLGKQRALESQFDATS